MEKRETKSPIKNLPVRQPGQSTWERMALLGLCGEYSLSKNGVEV